MRRILLFILFIFSSVLGNAQASKGFFNDYIPNLQQYSQQSLYINNPNIVIGGNYFAVTTWAASILETDTNGNFKNMWEFNQSDNEYTELYRARKLDANNCVVTGGVYLPTVSGYSGFIGTFNFTSGTFNSGYAYNSNAQLGGAGGSGNFIAEDGIALANGDLACTGPMDQTIQSGLGASSLGQWNCGAPIYSGGAGYLDLDFGTQWYERGYDICLMRTGSNGDTATGVGNDGFVKKYSLAYSGGGGCGYTGPAQPTPVGHTTGTFAYVYNSSWIGDSTRQDYPISLIEDPNHNIFICGYTYNYSSYNDYEGFILKVNSAGVTQWCRTFYFINATDAYQEINNMALVTEDGTDDIMCTISDDWQYGYCEVMRVANATGNVVWSKGFNLGTYGWTWGIHKTTNTTVGTGYNIFEVGYVGYNLPGAFGSYNFALITIDDKGNYLSGLGIGISPENGPNWSPDVDQAGTGSYFMSGNTPYTGGTTNGSLVAKINRQNNTTGCAGTYQFPVTLNSTVNRMLGDGNQIHERAPVIYETRGGATKTALTMTVASSGVSFAALNCVLPIELISFTGEYNATADCTNLQWSTATETDNHYFFIERSTDGEHWQTIDTVAGAGNSDQTRYYTAIDHHPPVGIDYYRLIQEDYDGNRQSFNVVTINIIATKTITLFPNPASTVVTIEGENLQAASIYNALGQNIWNGNAADSKLTIDISSFADGLYIVQAIDKVGNTTRLKFTKQAHG